MEFYLIDINIQEPAMLQRYEEVIPRTDRALPQPRGR
jgi:hypothetical protein